MFKGRRRKKDEAYRRELIELHQAEVEAMYDEMRGWRHDFKNHIQVLKTMLVNESLEDLRDYLDELDSSLTRIEPRIKTGNKMADAILNSKLNLAKSEGIRVEADANIPVELSISGLELSTIIGNLLDNAIESNMKLDVEDRFIRFYMDMKNTQLYISITNAAEPIKKKKLGGLFLSTKGEDHGLGLARIDEIVDRYGGYINRNSESGAFTTELLLPQK